MPRSRFHWLFTIAAVFLLLFTAVDLAYPQMCAEDGDDSFVVSRSSSATAEITTADTSPTDPTPVHADDCFCCCGHVLAGAIFHVAMPGEITQDHFFLTAQRVAVPPPPTFRPPRLG